MTLTVPTAEELTAQFPELAGFTTLVGDEMVELDGGSWSWKAFGQSTISCAIGGAAGGALSGAVTLGTTTIPGAVAGGIVGGVAGAVSYAVCGWW